MTTWYHSSLKFLLVLFALGLGSCAHYHTEISREIASLESKPKDVSNLSVKQSNKSDSNTDIENFSREVAETRDFHLNWPVDSARLTRGFLPHKRRPHLGVDLAAPKGTPILAAQNGMVIYAGRDFKGYGKMVLIESGNGYATLYAHFDKIYVSEGQRVHNGEVIGAMGRTGRATGVHLHFEVRRDKGPVDPLPLLPGGPRIAKLIR